MERAAVVLPEIPGLATPLVFDAWSIEPALARMLYNTVLGLGPRTIVELGSGVSTVVLAHAVRRRGTGGTIVAYEAEMEYLEATRRALERESLHHLVHLIHAPLGDVKIDGSTQRWYRIPEPLPFESIDLLFVDGPPGTTAPLARYPARGRFAKQLRRRSIIILDDANRTDEREVLARWREDSPQLAITRVNTRRGAAVLVDPSRGHRDAGRAALDATLEARRVSAPVPPISTIVVPTRHRAAELRCALTSHAAAAAAFRREVRIVVVDDSDADRTAEVAAVVHDVALAHDVAVEHASAPIRRELIARLCSAGAPEHETQFALGVGRAGSVTAAGAARNHGLLVTIGETIVASDDDVLADLDADGDAGLQIAAAADPTEIRPIEDLEPSPSATDVLGIIGRGLVGDVSELAARWHGPIETADVDARTIAALAGPEPRPVLVVAPGLRGDPGMGVPAHLLLASGRSRRHLLDLADDRYGAFVGHPRVRRAVPRATLTKQPFGFAACVGLDNRDFLPPFMPLGRNQDGVFFALVRRIAPRSFTLLLPHAIAHAGGGTAATSIVDTVAHARVNDFVVHAILDRDVSSGATSPEQRCIELGHGLIALASSSDESLREEIRRWWAQSCAGFVHRSIEARRSARRAPPAWREDVARIEALARAAMDHGEPLPLVDARESVGELGRLLVQWPAIRAAARRLRAAP